MVVFPSVREFFRAVLSSAPLRGCVVAGCVWLGAAKGAEASQAQPATAFGLARMANRHVGEQCRDRVVEIYSERSTGGLLPEVWHVVFYDPQATFRSSVVKFEAGKEPVVRRPMRLLEALAGGHLPLDRSRLKVDSDEALKIAAREPGLAGLELRGTQFALLRAEEAPV